MTEVRVGILFFIGLACLLGFSMFVNDFGGGTGTFSIRFERVAGLSSGDSVLYNGIKVGKVATVAPIIVNEEPLVEVSFNIDDIHKPMVLINPDSHFTIGSGLLGGNVLTIQSSGPGQAISNRGLAGRIGATPASISDAVNALSEVIRENRADLRDAIDLLPTAVENFANLSGGLDEVVQENKEAIRRAVNGFGTMTESITDLVNDNSDRVRLALEHFSTMSDEISQMVKENRQNVKQAIDGLPGMVDNISGAADEVEQMVAENRSSVRQAAESFGRFGPNLEKIGEDVALITDQVASGRGTVGRLVFEDTIHDRAEESLTAFEMRMKEIEPITQGFSRLRLYLGVTGGRNMKNGAGSGLAYLRIEPRPWKLYEAGVGWRTAPTDREVADEDPNKLNIDLHLMFGWRFFADNRNERYILTAKGGLIEGNFGGQLDLSLTRSDRLKLSLLARAKDNDREEDDRRYENGTFMLRSYLQYRVWRLVYVEAGVDDIVDNPEFWLALRAELLDNDIGSMTTAAGLVP